MQNRSNIEGNSVKVVKLLNRLDETNRSDTLKPFDIKLAKPSLEFRPGAELASRLKKSHTEEMGPKLASAKAVILKRFESASGPFLWIYWNSNV